MTAEASEWYTCGVTSACEATFLQTIQDRLADFYGLPMCLWDWQRTVEAVADPAATPTKVQQGLLSVHHWSRAQTLFQILDEYPELLDEINAPLDSVIGKVLRAAEKGDWAPRIAGPGLFDWHRLVVPLTNFDIQGAPSRSRGRVGTYLLCVGPFREGPSSLSWQSARAQVSARLAGASKALQNQLAGELMEIPTRPSAQQALAEGKELALIWNGIARDLVRLRKEKRLPYDVGAGLEEVVYELFRHVCNRERYFGVLRPLVAGLYPSVVAAGFLMRNPSTGTGFCALHIHAKETGASDLTPDVLTFLPLPDRVSELFSASTVDAFPEEDFWSLRRICESRVIHLMDVEAPPGRAENSMGRLVLVLPSAKTVERVLRRTELLSRAYLAGLISSWVPTAETVASRVFQSRESILLHKRNELSDAMELVPLPGGMGSERKSENLCRILAACRMIIGYEDAVYYRPVLYGPQLTAEPFASSSGQTGGEALQLSPEWFAALFDELEPVFNPTAAEVIFPVLSGNRCIALVRFVFQDSYGVELNFPLMVSLVSRLGARVLHERLIGLLQSIAMFLRDRPNDFGTRLAETFARLFSEGGCSIWQYNSTTRRCKLRGRAGFSLPDLQGELDASELKGTLIERCVSSEGPIAVNLDREDVRSGPELKALGFRHGFLVPSRVAGYTIVIALWSKAEPNDAYFSEDDLRIVTFVSVVLSQYLQLEQLIQERETLFDTILAGLGHEVMAPLGYLTENIRRMERTGLRPRGGDSLSKVAEYIYTLMGNFSIYAELDKPRPAAGGARAVALFRGIIFKVANILNWTIEARGMHVVEEFEARFFPSGIRINSDQERYLIAILFNILGNAVKYSTPDEHRDIRVIGSMGGDSIKLAVSNYGIGIPLGEEERIFERNTRGSNAWRATPVGSGLGLFISRELARRLGGDLVLSRRHNPTEFTLTLPAAWAIWNKDEVPEYGQDTGH